MRVIVPDKLFHEETSGAHAAKLFPYLAGRLDAIREIKSFERDIATISNFGRLLLAKNGSKMRRIGSIPMVILEEAIQMYGDDFLHNTKKLHKFFQANPEWSFIYDR